MVTFATDGCDGTVAGGTCSHVCFDAGYEGGSVTCSADGSYAVVACTARVDHCDAAEPGLGSDMTAIATDGCDGTAAHTTCAHSCVDAGYEGGSVTCSADGSYAVVACSLMSCDVSGVTAPLNGRFGSLCAADSSSITSGSICDLRCDTGYTLSNQPSCIGTSLSSTTATCTVQTCDVSDVVAPTNGQFGALCAAAATTINHGVACDLSCDSGFSVRAQPICIGTALSSTTAACEPDGSSFDLEPQQSVSIQVETRVDTILSEQNIRAALASEDVEVVEVTVTQEVEIPLRELPGAAADYSDDPGCTECRVKRYLLATRHSKQPLSLIW